MRWSGRVWRFGDDIDTDVMLPGKALRLPPDEAVHLTFDAVRPGWSRTVGEGDIIVGGRNFGVGSSRPVAGLLRSVGVRAVFAESMSSLFQRNTVNAGVLAVAVEGIGALVDEGDELDVDLGAGRVANLSAGIVFDLPALPQPLVDVVQAGGLVARLRSEGYLPAEGTAVSPPLRSR